MTDVEVIEATRRGDREAFAVLVARYQRMVEAIAFASCGERAAVDDIVQDAFVTAWRTIERLRDPANLRGWLGGITRNLARNARRRSKTRREAPLPEVVAPDSAFDRVADQQSAREIADALARLPDRYREPIVLFYYEHCTVKEVADALALREDAVMQRLSRGRRRLGEELATRVEIDLERKPSRAALAAALLLLLPVRSAAAATTPWWHALAAYWRIPACALAVAGAALVLMTAVTRSNEIAAHAAARSEPPRQSEPAPRSEPPARPQLPAGERSDRLHRIIIVPSTDAAESCARGAQALAITALGHHTIKKVGDNWYPVDPSQETKALLERVGARAAEECAGEPVPEIYMICEGMFDEVMEGNINCYPHDPFAI